MHVTMIETTKGSPNGIMINTYESGETYDLPYELANAFINAKFAKKATKKAVETVQTEMQIPEINE